MGSGGSLLPSGALIVTVDKAGRKEAEGGERRAGQRP
jgi:hypothetical protein